MVTSVPTVETANHTHPLRVGRPNRKTDTRHSVNDPHLGTELFIDAPFISLAEQIQVRLPEGGQKGIGIARATHLALLVSDHQIIRINVFGFPGGAFEQTVLVDLFEHDAWFGFLVRRNDFHAGGLADERTHHQSRSVGQGVRAQKFVRIAMLRLDQAFDFGLLQNHNQFRCLGSCLSDHFFHNIKGVAAAYKLSSGSRPDSRSAACRHSAETRAN